MSNHRAERALLLLERPIPGIDHLRAIDAAELLYATSNRCDADSAGIRPFEDFCFGWFGKVKWANAQEGLRTTRELIALYEKWKTMGPQPGQGTVESLEQKITVLRKLEALLDQADARDIRFCLAIRD